MTMLIRGGTVHTMAAKGTIIADVLIEDGCIAAIGPDLVPAQDVCTLSAQGLHVLPGLIDAHIIRNGADDAHLLHLVRSSGVTSAIVWPDSEGPCHLLHGDGIREADIHRLNAENCTPDTMEAMEVQHIRPMVQVDDAAACRRVLYAAAKSGTRPILLHAAGCEGLAQAIADAGCTVILGVQEGRRGASWAFAAQLDALGVPVALTVSHPHAALKHLPLCASLCVRDGLPRERALHLITDQAADILGLEDVGRIRPGDRADLTLYDGDPLLLATGHVITIHGGRICC